MEKYNYLYYQETGRVILYQRGGKVSLQKLLQISKSKFISKASVQVFKMVKNRYEMWEKEKMWDVLATINKITAPLCTTKHVPYKALHSS